MPNRDAPENTLESLAFAVQDYSGAPSGRAYNANIRDNLLPKGFRDKLQELEKSMGSLDPEAVKKIAQGFIDNASKDSSYSTVVLQSIVDKGIKNTVIDLNDKTDAIQKFTEVSYKIPRQSLSVDRDYEAISASLKDANLSLDEIKQATALLENKYFDKKIARDGAVADKSFAVFDTVGKSESDNKKANVTVSIDRQLVAFNEKYDKPLEKGSEISTVIGGKTFTYIVKDEKGHLEQTNPAPEKEVAVAPTKEEPAPVKTAPIERPVATDKNGEILAKGSVVEIETNKYPDGTQGLAHTEKYNVVDDEGHTEKASSPKTLSKKELKAESKRLEQEAKQLKEAIKEAEKAEEKAIKAEKEAQKKPTEKNLERAEEAREKADLAKEKLDDLRHQEKTEERKNQQSKIEAAPENLRESLAQYFKSASNTSKAIASVAPTQVSVDQGRGNGESHGA